MNIPEEAVEAAARSFPGYTPEAKADDLEREINAACRSTARRILEAAAPHMRVQYLGRIVTQDGTTDNISCATIEGYS